MLKYIPFKRWLEFDAMIAIVIIIASAGLMGVADPDFFWHLKTGEILIDSGAFITTDLFSHTAKGGPIQVTGWLFDAIIAWIDRKSGFTGIRILSAAFIFLTWLAVYHCVKLYIPRKQSAALLALFSIALLAPLIAVRPNLFTHAAFAWVLYGLLHYCRYQRFNRILWVLPLFFVWPYFHFGFAAGLGLIGLFIAAAWMDSIVPLSDIQPIRHLKKITSLAILLACAFVATLNNYGPDIYRILLEMTMRASTSPVLEWESPDFKPPLQKLLLLSIFLYLLLLFIQKNNSSWLTFVVPAALLWSLFTAQRNQGFWAIILPVFIAILIAGHVGARGSPKNSISERLERNSPPPPITYVLNAFIILLTLLVVTLKAPEVTKKHFEEAGALFPIEATDFLLSAVPDGRVFNRYGSGGYLIWRTYPKFPVFVDGRYEPYTDQIVKDSLHILAALPGTLKLLENYQVEIALAETKTALFHTLNTSHTYRLVYSDSLHSVFVLDNAKYRDLGTVSPAREGEDLKQLENKA